VSGMLFQAHTHSGIISWLARQCSVTPMTTGRYLQGKVHPVPYIARRISTALEWPWDELVASILEERVGRAVRDHYRKYHTCVQVGNSEPR